MTETLLPHNASVIERALDASGARIGDLPVALREIWSPADCPPPLLPWLAWAFGVEEWDPAWSPQQQRDTITAALPIKRHKGTIGAVRDAIQALGITARVQEWFAQIPAGDPYTYRLLLEVDQIGYDLDGLNRMLKVVARAKNLRSQLDIIQPSVRSRATPAIAAATSLGNDIGIDYGGLTYSDGASAIDLMIDAAVNGEADTVGAIDALHTLVNHTMPQPAYW